jgi:hypothetical protein
MKFISDIRLLLLGLWLGAAVFFIGVAASAFAVVPQRELAGAIVNRTLTILNFSGIAIAALLLVLSLATARNTNRLLAWLDRGLVLIVGAACAVGQFVIGMMMVSVRSQMAGKPIDEFAIDDPLRVQFNSLHSYSENILMIGMAAALIAFFVMANRRTAAVVVNDTTEPYNFEKEFKI